MNISNVSSGGPMADQTVMKNRPLGNEQQGAMPEKPAAQNNPADSYMPSPLASNEDRTVMPEPIASTDSPVGGTGIGEQPTDMAAIKRQDRLFDQATQNNMVENLRNTREANQGTGRLLDMIV